MHDGEPSDNDTMTPTEQAVPDVAARRFPCGQCGADLEFRPGAEMLHCPYCGATTTIEASDTAIVELDYREHLARLAETQPQVQPAEMQCRGCAAVVQRPPNMAAMACPFCGQSLIELDDRRRLIKPGSLLPFSVTSEQAWNAFRQWMRGRWFAPTKLKRFARSEGRFRGVYVPFWTYDAVVTTTYTGQRGEHYDVTVGTGDDRRRERRTRWYPAAGTVVDGFDDLLVLASRSQPVQQVGRLDPWDLENLVPVSEEYLAGMLAESYEIDLPGGFELARPAIDATVRRTVKRDIGGDTQRITTMQMSFDELTFKHILLPVWVGSYRFRDRVFTVLVNGRTGEVQGERPWSWVKIVLAVLAAAVVIAIALVVRAV